ncbi:MAG TPA: hypothetical protein VIW29_18325 [Polyangiaceae bacterium]
MGARGAGVLTQSVGWLMAGPPPPPLLLLLLPLPLLPPAVLPEPAALAGTAPSGDPVTIAVQPPVESTIQATENAPQSASFSGEKFSSEKFSGRTRRGFIDIWSGAQPPNQFTISTGLPAPDAD